MTQSPPAHYLAVAAGSALGGLVRHLLSVAVLAFWGGGFPWPTLLANWGGSFLIGLYVALNLPGGPLQHSATVRHFVVAGFCAGFTTFSLFSLETLLLLEAGRPGPALAYALTSVLGWLVAVWSGYRLGCRLRRPAQ
ncbi:MAG: fluoride efflux transporter FluC [Wenzhouxiangella sp.]